MWPRCVLSVIQLVSVVLIDRTISRITRAYQNGVSVRKELQQKQFSSQNKKNGLKTEWSIYKLIEFYCDICTQVSILFQQPSVWV